SQTGNPTCSGTTKADAKTCRPPRCKCCSTPSRGRVARRWVRPGRRHLSFFLDEYKYDYGALHPPYQQADNQRRLTEVLHPVFIKRQSGPLNIAHVTDTHVAIRPDVNEENLRREGKLAGVSFNNYNKDFIEIYREAKQPPGAQPSDVILLTGDLIDYGRGHVGLIANANYRQALGQQELHVSGLHQPRQSRLALH